MVKKSKNTKQIRYDNIDTIERTWLERALVWMGGQEGESGKLCVLPRTQQCSLSEMPFGSARQASLKVLAAVCLHFHSCGDAPSAVGFLQLSSPLQLQQTYGGKFI